MDQYIKFSPLFLVKSSFLGYLLYNSTLVIHYYVKDIKSAFSEKTAVEGFLELINLLFLVSSVHRYWRDRGVKSPERKTRFKNLLMFIFPKNFGIVLKDLYDQYPHEAMVGYFDFTRPNLMVKDPALLEQVLVKDFPSYSHHGMLVDEEDDRPLDISLFTMAGNKWRALRNKMTPTFTTGKLRGMTSLMVQCYKNTQKYLENVGDGKDIDIKEAMAMFATDVVGSCVFGMDTYSLGLPGSEFRKMGNKLFHVTPLRFLKLTILFSFPRLAKMLKLTFNEPEIVEYFHKITLEAIEMRKKDRAVRNDFLQLLLELREKGTIELHTKDVDADDDYLKTDEIYITETFEMTDQMMVSQALSFLTAGFEGVSLGLSYLCLEIALNPQIQDKLRAEIEDKLKQHGVMTYEVIKEMKYLDQCISEIFRKYPVANILSRQVTKPTKLNGVDLEVGTNIFVPVMGLHYDETYYPEPNKFDPDRFHHSAHRHPFTYLPFGDGPRVCIGMRFALLEMKVCIANLVRDFNMTVSSKTKLPFEFDGSNFMLSPKNKIFIRMTKLEKMSE